MEKIKKRNIRFISLIVSLILMLCVFSGFPNNNVFAAGETSGTCGTNVTWSYNTYTYTLTISGTGAMSSYYYSLYQGNYVTEAPWRAYFKTMKTLVINTGVTSIGDYAFCHCTGLTSVTIGNSVKSIGGLAFSFCTGLTRITIGNSVTSIGSYAFERCTGLTSVTIPNRVTSIGYRAFSYCAGLTSVTIGNSVTSIDSFAFEGCTSLTSVTIGNSVTNIGSRAFEECTGLTSIKIPDSVTSIGENAFRGCSSLREITLPFVGNKRRTSTDTYQYPLGYIFGTSSYTGGTETTQYYYGSSTSSTTSETYYIPSSLKKVTITDCKYIPRGAFYNCSGLTSITIPDSVTSIGERAFSGCTGLTSITIPDSVTSIGVWAFYACKSLTGITFPDSVTSIGEYAFYYCTGLTSITIPDSVTSIDSYAFSDCTGLKKVNYTGIIADWCNISFGNYSANPLYYAHNLYINNKLVTDLVIPDTVKEIKNYAFYGCTGLKEICVLSKTAYIGSNAIPKATRIYCYRNSTAETYAKENGNDYHLDILSTSEDCSCQFINGILYISGTGEMENYKTAASVPWYEYRDEITEIRIENGVTKVGTYAFYCLDNLKTVKSENKDLQLSKYSLNADNKNNTVYSTGGGALQEYCDQNGIAFVKPTPDTPSAPVLSAVNGTSITVKEEPGTEYSLDKINWQDRGVFTGLSPVTNYSIYARIKETAEHNASGISVALTVKTTKLNNDNIPPIPTFKSITSSSISVNTETGIEYSINGTSWNTAGTFSGLKSGTEYSIFARYKATATHLASMASEPLTVKTDKATVSAPAAPDYEAHTENSITLKPNALYEFSIDGENWQKSNVFTNLSKNTIYRFYQRVAETDTEYTSKKSPALITAIPDRPEILSASYDEITVKDINGFEYCLDDFVWQSDIKFDMLIDNMEYYVYQRIAKIDGEKVYQITSDYTAVTTDNSIIHIHTFDDWNTTAAPTCTEKGEEERVCSVCEYKETRDIEALGHDYKAVITEPTCTEQGYTTHKCTRCDSSYKDTYVEATGHKPGNAVKENETGATCTEKSSYDEVVYCSVCKTEISRTKKYGNALGHDYKQTITAPTCTEKGYTTHKCTRCDSSYNDTYVEALGHKPGETTIENSVAPTCETAGSYDEGVYCTVCHAELSRDTKTVLALGHDWSKEWSNDGTNHWHMCNRCEKITDNAEHIYGEWIETKPAKVNEKGERKHICEICGYEEYEEFELGYIVGDTNGDEVITDQDAIYLLFNYYFPDKYPIDQPCDFNKDGEVTDQDAIYLLFHYYFPDKYPIE